MNRIIKIGMDVHSTNYTLCAMEPTIGAEDRVFGEIQVAPDYKEIIYFIESLKFKLGLSNDYSIECGYEAGCLGYTLYHQLTRAGINCVIMAPTTMLTQQGHRVKTDKRDARLIAHCLCYGGYHQVYIPTGKGLYFFSSLRRMSYSFFTSSVLAGTMNNKVEFLSI